MNKISLDLNESEENAYYCLIAFGQLSFGEFCHYNKLESEEAKAILTSLEKKGLTEQVKGLSDRYLPKFPFLNIAEKFNEPIAKFTELKNELSNFFSTKEQEVKLNQDASIENLNKAINPKIDEIKTQEDKLAKQVESKKLEFNGVISESETNFTSKFEENKSNFSNDFNSKKSSTVETAFSKSTEKKEFVLNSTKQFSENVSSHIDVFFSNLDNTILSEIVKNFDELRNLLSGLNTDIENHGTSFKESMSSLFDQSSTESESYLKSSLNSFSDSITKTREEIASEREALGILDLNIEDLSKFESINSKITQPLTDLRNLLIASKTEIIAFKESFEGAFNVLISSDKVSVEQSVEDSKNHIKTVVSTFKESITNQNSSFKSMISEIKEKNNKRTEELVSGMIESINSFKTDFSSTLDEFGTHWTSMQDDISAKNGGSITEIETGLISSLDSLKSKSVELRDKFLSQGNEMNESNSEKLNSKILSSTKHLVSSYDSVITEQDNNLSSLIEANKNHYDEKLSSLQTNFQTMKTNLDDILNKINSESQSKLEAQSQNLNASSVQSKAKFEETKSNLGENIKSKQAEIIKSLDEQNSAFYDEMLFLQNTLLNDLGQLVDQFQSNISDLTLNQMKDLLSSLQDKFSYITGVQDLIVASTKTFTQKESEIRESFISGVTDQTRILQTNIKEHVGEIEKLVKVGEDLLTPSTTILSDFDQIVKSYGYPKISSAPLIGWSASIQQIHNMVGVMKSRVTLLFPEPGDIPLDLIANTKRPKRIDLSSNFDLNINEHKMIAKRLLEQDNVTLRNIEIRSGGEFPPFLACDIDGEEVMFGTQDPTNKTAFVGMVSQIPEFIQLVGKVLLSDFLSRAKRIAPGDI